MDILWLSTKLTVSVRGRREGRVEKSNRLTVMINNIIQCVSGSKSGEREGGKEGERGRGGAGRGVVKGDIRLVGG